MYNALLLYDDQAVLAGISNVLPFLRYAACDGILRLVQTGKFFAHQEKVSTFAARFSEIAYFSI